jgi:putative Ca2+/H+ antiporter (TMEM165/GDT1 family)
MAGILTATLLNHGLASWGGAWISEHLTPALTKYILSAVFIGFGLWILVPDKDDNDERPAKFGAYLTTVVTFFLAEMGDKTQLATIALGARFNSFLWVTIGTTLGMLFSDGIAVFVGEKFSGKIPMRYVRWFASTLFILFGVLILFR